MGIFKRTDKQPDNPYHGLRAQALNIKPSDLGIQPDNNHPVYGAVVDMQMGAATATMVCMADGTVSLYFENGGGFIGVGQKYEAVRKEGIDLLNNAARILHTLNPAVSFPLPNYQMHNVYLLTKDGIYTTTIDPKLINNEKDEIKFLFVLYQRLLSKIRENIGDQ
jgi:hypothetical protein